MIQRAPQVFRFIVERQIAAIAAILMLILAAWISRDLERSIAGVFYVLAWSHTHLIVWILIWMCFCTSALLTAKWAKLANVTLLLAAVSGGTALIKLLVYIPFWLRNETNSVPFSVTWSTAVIVAAFWTAFALSNARRGVLFFSLAVVGTAMPIAWQILDRIAH